VVARSNNALAPDSVYLIVQQTAQPTTYRTVVSWRIERSMMKELTCLKS